MGFPYRPAFARAAGTNTRSVYLLENALGVGPVPLRAVAGFITWWTEDTPWLILNGEPAPSIPNRVEHESPSREQVDKDALLLVALRNDHTAFGTLYHDLRLRYSPDEMTQVEQRVTKLTAVDETNKPIINCGDM